MRASYSSVDRLVRLGMVRSNISANIKISAQTAEDIVINVLLSEHDDAGASTGPHADNSTG